MRAVILAGGKGTRLRPLTDTRPKPLMPFMCAPFAAGLLRRLQAAGASSATFLVGADAQPFAPLRDLGRDLGIEVTVATEERPLDTAGAARRLLAAEGDTALVCNGDILTDLDFVELLRAHRKGDAVATLALTHLSDTSSFGVVVCDPDDRVVRFVEKPPPGTEPATTVNAGTYVLEPAALEAFPGDGPLSFERTVFPELVAGGAPVLGVPSAAFWADLGTPRRYLDGHAAVLTGRCSWPLPEGLRLVGESVAVHADARIHPDARLGPLAVVDAGCEVGPSATVADAVLHEAVRVGAHARVQSAVLGRGATVGDRAEALNAVLADGTVLRGGAQVSGCVSRSSS